MNWYRLAQQRYLWDNDPDLPVANASSREEYWDLKYPRAGQSVSGLTVGDRVDNTSSIGASLESYYVYPDIREVPMSDFSGGGYATSDDFRRSRALIEQIRGSGLINPLIVAIDEKGPYILEGGHRFDALREMGVPSFPALVVLETVENGTLQRQGQAKLAATARQLMSIGVEVVNGKAILYRGTNISGLTADDLRYGDFLSSVPSGTDVTGNAGADSYGKYVERYEIPVEYVEISNGELQYKGPSKSLSGGGKYPEAIYRAYNDAQGSNSTAAEIDKESDFYVRQVAGMALPGGKEEFDKLLQQHRGGGSTKQAQQQFNTGDKFEMGDIVELPFQEGAPSPEKAQQMKEWISRNQNIYLPSYVKMYHATDPSIPVLEEGLKPTSTNRRRSYQSASGFVYLANTPARAKMFGDLGNQGRSVVYEVIVPVTKLKPDLDQLNNLRSTGVEVGNSLAESIVYGGGARLKGEVEPHAIRLFSAG